MITSLWSTYWLFTGTVEGIFYFWPVSLFLALNAVAAMVFSRIPKKPLQLFALLSPFVWPLLILGIGGACWNEGNRMSTSAIPTIGVTMILGIQIILSLGITYTLSGRRWVTGSVGLIAIWLGLISWFVAGMALTNVWL
jgi:hypothetical protein